ncbi:hypothetical protein BDZ91DRAFT_797330 [Kalaharituber pfeilii]|nr:hypothetical protein BDZ91DRAFT_797330 [Kalaharituber pfeilii]
MKRDAKGTLGQALQEQELHAEDMRGELFVGNRRGLNVAGLASRVGALELKTASLKQDKVEKDIKLLRNRFINNFKRDVLENGTDDDRSIIEGSNACAQGDEPVIEA